jgi:hypothetical protein
MKNPSRVFSNVNEVCDFPIIFSGGVGPPLPHGGVIGGTPLSDTGFGAEAPAWRPGKNERGERAGGPPSGYLAGGGHSWRWDARGAGDWRREEWGWGYDQSIMGYDNRRSYHQNWIR